MKGGHNMTGRADMTAWPRKEPKSAVCAMCGEQVPTVVIMDPNRFPDNGLNDTLDVCDECKEFVEAGVGDSYRRMGLEIADKHNIPVSDALLPEMPMAEELKKYGTLVGKSKNDYKMYQYRGCYYTLIKKDKTTTEIRKIDGIPENAKPVKLKVK